MRAPIPALALAVGALACAAERVPGHDPAVSGIAEFESLLGATMQ